MPVGSFRMSIVVKNPKVFADMRDRMKSFRPVWDAIIDRWLRHNKDKFAQSAGMESTGTSYDFGTRWKPLSSRYMAAKRRAGFEDWLMVRTGELRNSLTRRDEMAWFEQVGDLRAAFGTLDKKAGWNWETRPVTFLDRQDLEMSQRMFVTYLSGQPPFRTYRSTTKQMNAEYHGILNPLGIG